MTDTTAYRLSDRFAAEEGRVFLTGLQAVARLPVDQLRLDRRHGLNTAAYVTGYQGSPVGTLAEEVARASRAVPDLPVVNQRGVNEELAATAVMGSQLAVTLADCQYDGILGLWYGKGPGIDRAGDAIRHAVYAGTAPHGGVVAVVGDDPSAKSSTVPSSSDATIVDLRMPLLYPGDPQEALDLGRHAVALSRASGLWVGLKLLTQVADGSGTVDIAVDRVTPTIPTMDVDGVPFRPQPSGQLLPPRILAIEREIAEVRREIARRYAVANHLNQVTVRSTQDWIGIAAAGYTFHEVREALGALGLVRDEDLQAAGIRLFQILMPSPIDRGDIREFAKGLQEILVIEEKTPTLELLVRDALYDLSDRPRVWGKRDESGQLLVPLDSHLDAGRIVPALRHHLQARLGDRLTPAAPAPRAMLPLAVNRAPYFCSGCPHNTSTRVEPDTLVGAGIGCHAMVAYMGPERTGELVGLTCMGNEGAQWIGMAPFVERTHLVQNLGDGTFFHSGSLAVRASVAAGVDITYKLLHNGTVAMTGGQDAQGAVDVPAIAAMLLAEGVRRVIVTSDEPGRFPRGAMPAGVDVWERERLDEAQRTLATIKGTTVLIHDQGCAAEKRRARRRGTLATPAYRVVINERICEGCGDCGATSNCLSVQPAETPFGRKTAIHQTSCNLDLSCVKGDCPAFATVSVSGGVADERTPPQAPEPSTLPTPTSVVDPERFTVRLSGIGGTGVVTVSQLLGTAALLEGRQVRGLDQTGLSQKAGPVVSDLRITREVPAASNHPMAGDVDTLLAFDLLTAASDAHRNGASAGRTVVVGAVGVVPTGAMVVDPGARAYPALEELRGRLDEVSRPEVNRYVDAGALTGGLLGSSTTANVFLLGVAVQLGAVPLEPGSLERAIALNGVAVAQNVAAFRFGRQWAVDPAAVEALSGVSGPRVESVDQLVERLTADLTDYQDAAYAGRFRSRVASVRAAEARVAPRSTALTATVARNLHKLMAYKDEYEVARLALLPESRGRYEAVGGPDTEVTYHLHPPMLRALGMTRKLRLGRSGAPAFAALRAMKRLRGTAADPFGRDEVRRVERAMIPEFEAAIDALVAGLTADRLAEAVGIAELPDQVRGYESLKRTRAAAYRAELATRLTAYQK